MLVNYQTRETVCHEKLRAKYPQSVVVAVTPKNKVSALLHLKVPKKTTEGSKVAAEPIKAHGLTVNDLTRLRFVGQFNMSFLVFAHDKETLVLFDQHAVHERIRLEHLKKFGGDKEELKTEACRGAIKFGDAVSRDTALQMIGQLVKCEFPFACAHGRRSVLVIGKT